MKITFIVPSLADTGGAERIISIMANYWAGKKQVAIVTFDNGLVPPFFKLDTKIIVDNLDLPLESRTFLAGLAANRQRVKRLKQYLETTKPDIVISFLTNTNLTALLAARGTRIPVIVSERNHPAYTPIDPLRKKIRRLLYPKANAVVCQTEGILNYYQQLLSHNGVIIPNPVLKPDPNPRPLEIELPAGHIVLAAGSMSKAKVYQKGFDQLIPLFANLTNDYPDWNLVILGDGKERLKLINKVQELGLSDRIVLPGNVKNIHAVFRLSDIFILSSRYEGFPNVLCEAMACGLPAVSFDCPTGPSDIIRNGVDGLLVQPENIPAFENALNRLIMKELERKKLAAKAVDVVERFSLKRVMGKWEKIILKILGDKHK